MVVKFDDKEVQLPSVDLKLKTVFVECIGSKYVVVDKPEALDEQIQDSEDNIKINRVKKTKKQPTKIENVIDGTIETEASTIVNLSE